MPHPLGIGLRALADDFAVLMGAVQVDPTTEGEPR
jgi:hypothetical protein